MSDTGPSENPAGGDTGVSDLAREAAVQVAGPTGDGERPEFLRRQGYITAIASDWLTCSIKFPESTDPIPGVRFMHLHQHPHVGDTVWVDQNGADTIVSSIDAFPVGAFVMWPTATPPKGWLAMNGQSTSGYPKLAAIYGANLPNWDGLFAVGGGGAYAIASTGGVAAQTQAAAHQHTLNNHQHTQTAHDHPGFDHRHGVPDHSHPQNITAAVGGPGIRVDYANQDAACSAFPQGINTGGSGALQTGADGAAYRTGSGGGGLTNNGGVDGGGGLVTSAGVASVDNRPPYRAVLFIVKHD